MTILVTGGCGYIGSHTVLTLLEYGEDVVILDDLSNSSSECLSRISLITGKSAVFYHGNILNRACLKSIFSNHKINSVIHFAGLKSVCESVAEPIKYYQNNLVGSLFLLEEMVAAGVRELIFSSSATVYGNPEFVPLTENSQVGATTNPYGSSKVMVEQIFKDFALANKDFSITSLRYFNPAGAHPSGLIGEDPNGKPSNLIPYITQVAVGRLPKLTVYGNDYPTKDGSGVRDYIHVMDLAEGHLCALKKIKNGFNVYNLGTGIGSSVFQIIKEFEQITGVTVPFEIADRRCGDTAQCWSSPDLAYVVLGWQSKRTLSDMLKDAWKWQKLNPNGYEH
ncbi:UDP-glucose 4-epimerase GalE [Yersinia mollaretii]|uniref:UDP-glucose 4-epimerase GalE n=1 Tax=Yersinia mollaretii TaxID=33060 RepID=UPI0005E3F77F|nr:UDP-glucose 4-epimerase GalE [Yersinia mollaretii]MDN0111191.1 UDP-glucose 4-epimerase GalE [Yersinia mollaretii]PJE89565.1 UDP-glucose 4-epimerase GalE [Yersinia mollaretii]CQD43383.1 UDP-glucose 4-epimerase [Yersinia mollaretii]CQH00854.1 UDP-glucose 4-epimerase [Yersinia mollaretii]